MPLVVPSARMNRYLPPAGALLPIPRQGHEGLLFRLWKKLTCLSPKEGSERACYRLLGVAQSSRRTNLYEHLADSPAARAFFIFSIARVVARSKSGSESPSGLLSPAGCTLTLFLIEHAENCLLAIGERDPL